MAIFSFILNPQQDEKNKNERKSTRKRGRRRAKEYKERKISSKERKIQEVVGIERKASFSGIVIV